MRCLSGLFAAVVLSACSSVPNEPGPASTTPDTSVFDSCVEFATALCADAEACCTRAYGDFSAEGCLATFKRDVCRPGADAVQAGKAVFDADAIDACLAAHAQAHAVCVPTWQQTIELRKAIYGACHVISGTTEVGGGCAISATCKNAGGTSTSLCVKNVCRSVEILPEGAECPFPAGDVSVCDDGLTCDAPGRETTGHCVPVIATGQACDGGMLEGTECGLGSYCDTQSSACRVTENFGGSSCNQSTECVSFECDRSGEGQCAPAPAVVSRDICLGAPQQP